MSEFSGIRFFTHVLIFFLWCQKQPFQDDFCKSANWKGQLICNLIWSQSLWKKDKKLLNMNLGKVKSFGFLVGCLLVWLFFFHFNNCLNYCTNLMTHSFTIFSYARYSDVGRNTTSFSNSLDPSVRECVHSSSLILLPSC